MEIWQVTIPAEGRHVLFPTEEARRRAVHALARVAGGSLAHFCVADDHVHLVIVGARAAVGRRAQGVAASLAALSSSRLGSAHFTPVETRKHLERLVGYVSLQPTRHGLPAHVTLWTGSAHLDLLGARVLPGLRLRLEDVLPRFGPRRIAEAVGLHEFDLRPMSLEGIRRRGAFELASAAAAAFAARPDLLTNERPAVRARIAVAVLARAAGVSLAEVVDALRLSRRATRRHAGRQPDPRDLRAVRLRLSLERHVRDDRGGGPR